MTITTIPQKPPRILSVPEAREQLSLGLANATAALGPFWPVLDGMDDRDPRWDRLSERAARTVRLQVAALLDAAIAAEWERSPIEL